jgi:hypothetical protein
LLSIGASAQLKSSSDVALSGKIVHLYPNPASISLNVDLLRSSETNASLVIYNFMGKKIQEVKNINLHFSIDLQRYYRGIYIYQIRNRKGCIIDSGKFQIVK